MRAVVTLLHRWFGLAIAGFLFVSGATGAVISWDRELDELLNSHLFEASGRGTTLGPLELARQVESRDPRVRVTLLPLSAEPGRSLVIGVEPKRDSATGRLHEPGYNEVFLDPVTGIELGRREWGAAWPVNRENFISFLYRLHYSLHMPEFWGIDHWGQWLLGVVAVVWAVDCFVGLYLTLPLRHAPNSSRPADIQRALQRGWWIRWKPAWRIKTSGSRYRVTFDIHRAFGLWTWLLLFTLAFTAFSLNLYREIFYPLMSMVSEVTPDPFAIRTPADLDQPIEPLIGYGEIIDKGRAEAAARGWIEPAGDAFYAPEYGIYGVRFFRLGDENGVGGVGPAMLFYDGQDGRLLGDRRPWKGTAADLFVQAQFPLHSGRIAGLPGRILISFIGLAVATLSVTGVLIWHRKRRARTALRRPVQASSTGDHFRST